MNYFTIPREMLRFDNAICCRSNRYQNIYLRFDGWIIIRVGIRSLLDRNIICTFSCASMSQLIYNYAITMSVEFILYYKL